MNPTSSASASASRRPSASAGRWWTCPCGVIDDNVARPAGPASLAPLALIGPALLLLFDIDGTLLLKAYHAHGDALEAAIVSVYGLRKPRSPRVQAAGRTDLEIARAVLLANDVPPDRIEAGFDDLRAVACEEYARRCPSDLTANVAPGVPELLASLHAGNLEPIARLKLARAGLGRFFERGQGGFGSDHEDRAALPEIARRRAGADGRPYPRGRTIVIGDTPRDIACAHADGVRCVAVATGPYGVEELRDADAVASDGHGLARVLGKQVAAAA
jgi:phosphoglycolate phosphatase